MPCHAAPCLLLMLMLLLLLAGGELNKMAARVVRAYQDGLSWVYRWAPDWLVDLLSWFV